MSRNLCSTECYRCGTTPTLIEEPHPIIYEQAGISYNHVSPDDARAVQKALELKMLSSTSTKDENKALSKVYDSITKAQQEQDDDSES